MNNLNKTFSLLLKEYQKTGNLDDALETLNLTAEQKERILKAFQTIDAIEANAKSLRAAKEEGISRKNWLAQEILTTAKAKNLSEEQTDKTFAELGKAFAKTANNINKED